MRPQASYALQRVVIAGVLALLCSSLAIVLSPSCGSAYADEPSPDSPSDGSAPTTVGDPFRDAVAVDADDGIYLADIELQGGSGKASVSSPAELEVFDGRGVVKLVWSSPNYDYMLVEGEKYLPVNEEGDSTFVVPVLAYDEPFPVVGDTTAMGSPHEVEYTITVMRESMRPYDGSSADNEPEAPEQAEEAPPSEESSGGGGITWPWIVFAVCATLSVVAVGATIYVLRNYQNASKGASISDRSQEDR